jgi:hypothetical protein
VGSDALQTFTLTVNQAPAFTSAPNATFTVGTFGSFTVAASGFPAPSLSESSSDVFPSGVTFNAATGVLSGTPAVGSGNTYTLHFTAHNGVGSDAQQTFTLTVNEAPAFTSAPNATFTVGTFGSFTVAASGFPAPSLSESSSDVLPTGVTFNAATGELSGTPAVGSEGTYTLHFTAHNGVGGDPQQTFTLSVTFLSPGSNQTFVNALYATVLGRPGDTEGMDYWLNLLASGASRMVVAEGVWESAEHRASEVAGFYQTYLHRLPDPNGEQFWLKAFQTGADESAVALGFLTSAEYLANHASPGALVTALYQDVLGRDADPNGAAYWVGALQKGMSDREVVLAFLTSQEKVKGTVDSLYLSLLQRPDDENGAQYWSNALTSHRSVSLVAEGFLSSDEFFHKS